MILDVILYINVTIETLLLLCMEGDCYRYYFCCCTCLWVFSLLALFVWGVLFVSLVCVLCWRVCFRSFAFLDFGGFTSLYFIVVCFRFVQDLCDLRVVYSVLYYLFSGFLMYLLSLYLGGLIH